MAFSISPWRGIGLDVGYELLAWLRPSWIGDQGGLSLESPEAPRAQLLHFEHRVTNSFATKAVEERVQ